MTLKEIQNQSLPSILLWLIRYEIYWIIFAFLHTWNNFRQVRTFLTWELRSLGLIIDTLKSSFHLTLAFKVIWTILHRYLNYFRQFWTSLSFFLDIFIQILYKFHKDSKNCLISFLKILVFWDKFGQFGTNVDNFRQVWTMLISKISKFQRFQRFFLSFQFLQKQYDGILDLAASVDITAKADWELRLYSCDERKFQWFNEIFSKILSFCWLIL